MSIEEQPNMYNTPVNCTSYWHETPHVLRPNSQKRLVVPKTKLKYYDDKTVVKAAPSLWNQPPLKMRNISAPAEIKSELRTYPFKDARY